MKSIFDKATRDELINRINSLNESKTAQWGKMNLYQMLKHCRLWEEMMQSKINLKWVFIGRIFGRIALKTVLGNANPLKRNTPTIPSLYWRKRPLVPASCNNILSGRLR
jgi:lysozyme family protein